MAAPVRDPLLEGHVGPARLEDGHVEGRLLVVPRVERRQEGLQAVLPDGKI